MKMRDGGPTRMRASAADSARQVRQDLATGGRGVPRIIDGNQSPAATPRPVTSSRRPASGYIDRQRHAEGESPGRAAVYWEVPRHVCAHKMHGDVRRGSTAMRATTRPGWLSPRPQAWSWPIPWSGCGRQRWSVLCSRRTSLEPARAERGRRCAAMVVTPGVRWPAEAAPWARPRPARPFWLLTA